MRLPKLSGSSSLGIFFLALCVAILMPIPPFFIDLLLAFSIAFSMVLLLSSILVSHSTELQSFPVILLFITLLRLTLNIACTRLILARGHEGGHAAGEVISSIASIIMQDNFVIGVIIFAIIVVVNFIVITKGSERVAEVAARFTLDALPGKQMSVDADLSAGLITSDAAKLKRREIQEEISFYGAMDGAAKFVRGDAIAAIVIIFINLIGGTVVGVVQQNMQFTKALSTYLFLSIGEGLVAQISALLVSLAAGILVTKSTEQISLPLAKYPMITQITAGVSLCISVVPGIPTLPFLLIAVCLWWLPRLGKSATVDDEPKDENAVTEFHALKLEIGYGLIQFARDVMPAQVQLLRNKILETRGVQIPQIQIVDHANLGMNQYRFAVREVVVACGTLIPDRYMRINHSDKKESLESNFADQIPPRQNPNTIKPSIENQEDILVKDEVFDNYVTWSVAQSDDSYSTEQVFYAQLVYIINKHLHELICLEELNRLLSNLGAAHARLVQEIVPARVSRTTVKYVVQQLLRERLSVKDTAMILEAIADSAETNPAAMVESVRKYIARQICATFSQKGKLHVHKLSNGWTELCEKHLFNNGKGYSLALGVLATRQLVKEVVRIQKGVLLTSSNLRQHIADIIIRSGNFVPVLSYPEIAEGVQIEEMGAVADPD